MMPTSILRRRALQRIAPGAALLALPALADVVARPHAACNEIFVQPEIQKKVEELSIVGKPKRTAEFQAYVKEQVDVLGSTVNGAGIKL